MAYDIETADKDRIQYIVVKVGSEQYGIDIGYIDNIVRMSKITRVPKVQPYFQGIINLRGEVVPVMSIRRKMGLEDDEYTNSTRIVILKVENSGAIGIIVDAVKEVVTLSKDEIDSQPHNGKENNFINGVGKNAEELISLLDINAVLDDNIVG